MPANSCVSISRVAPPGCQVASSRRKIEKEGYIRRHFDSHLFGSLPPPQKIEPTEGTPNFKFWSHDSKTVFSSKKRGEERRSDPYPLFKTCMISTQPMAHKKYNSYSYTRGAIYGIACEKRQACDRGSERTVCCKSRSRCVHKCTAQPMCPRSLYKPNTIQYSIAVTAQMNGYCLMVATRCRVR